MNPRLVIVCLALSLLAAGATAQGGVGQHATDADEEELSAALARDPRPAHGARLARQCAVCHGRDAQGSRDGTAPSLAGQHFRYLVKQIVDFRDEQRFIAPIHDGIARTMLQSPQEIADLAAYLAELAPPTRPVTGPGERIERGAELYRTACQSCHGNAAVGKDALGIPSLHGQHYPYLLRQMTDLQRGHRMNAPPDLTLLLQDMPPDDAEAIADYLSRLPFEGSIVTRIAPPAVERALSARR